MTQTCWTVTRDAGFLITPDPIEDLITVDLPLDTEVTQNLMHLATSIPERIRAMTIRGDLSALQTHDMTPVQEVTDFRITERLFQIYSHFANAYVWCDQTNPSPFIPASVAVPLVQLSHMVERPPILPYASTGLANFKRVDPALGYDVDNLRCIQHMIDISDEAWFHLIHVEIEAHAGAAILGLMAASVAAKQGDAPRVSTELEQVPAAFDKMIKAFRRITERCSTETYYHTLRPYLFGFDNVIYEGVAEYGGKPMTFRGESGAQSTVIPAIKSLLGLVHAEGGLTEHLDIMTDYMPKPHQALLGQIDPTAIRGFAARTGDPNLADVYNLCLERMVDFRSLHLKMAHAFIAQKVKDPRGTGGTEFMKWLTMLRDETAAQMLPQTRSQTRSQTQG